MCYIEHIISRTRQPRLRPLWVPVKTSNRGVAISARRLCHRKRVKRVFPRVLKKPLRRAAALPKAVPGLPSRIPGKPPRPRLENPQKTKKKRKAKKACKNCRESDWFEVHCFEGCFFQDCPEQDCPEDRRHGFGD